MIPFGPLGIVLMWGLIGLTTLLDAMDLGFWRPVHPEAPCSNERAPAANVAAGPSVVSVNP